MPEMDVHTYFGLTYANYLVLHRSALQSMPREWQVRFVALCQELDDAIHESGIDTPYAFEVRCKDADGQYVEDPVQPYDRGRTRLPLAPREHERVPATESSDG